MALGKENRGQSGVPALIELATAARAQATGKGREGVNPFPGFLGKEVPFLGLHALRPAGLGG